MAEATLYELIGNYAFPIVMCIMMFYYIIKQGEQHKEEMDKMTEALNNNTIAITNITAKLEQNGVIK